MWKTDTGAAIIRDQPTGPTGLYVIPYGSRGVWMLSLLVLTESL